MTELTFLLELLLNHKLPKPTRELVTARIKEVELMLVTHQVIIPANSGLRPEMLSNQAHSMQAIMARHPDLAPAPVAVIAQTPQAAQAMASRQDAIAASLSGKIDKSTGRPRKF